MATILQPAAASAPLNAACSLSHVSIRVHDDFAEQNPVVMTKNQELDAIFFAEVTMSLLHFPCHIVASRLSQRDSNSAPRATPQSLPLSLREWPIKCPSMKEKMSSSSATRTGISNHWMLPSTSTQWQQADRSQTPKSQKSPSTTKTESEMEKTRILCI